MKIHAHLRLHTLLHTKFEDAIIGTYDNYVSLVRFIGVAQVFLRPPSTGMFIPVIKDAASEAKKKMTRATSLGS